jgi:hypothetical protein
MHFDNFQYLYVRYSLQFATTMASVIGNDLFFFRCASQHKLSARLDIFWQLTRISLFSFINRLCFSLSFSIEILPLARPLQSVRFLAV